MTSSTGRHLRLRRAPPLRTICTGGGASTITGFWCRRRRYTAPGILPEVAGSQASTQLERAINNLLDNAAKHGRGSGAVDADLPHLFDRFYRGADSRGRAGSGLGLAIVRQVAESHEGSVTAENAPGGGACLRLMLPVVAAASPLNASKDAACATPAQRAREDPHP
jgi:signal transduction histidine kinase